MFSSEFMLMGKIVDQETKAGVSNAVIRIPEFKRVFFCDSMGFFSNGNLPSAIFELQVSHTAYQTVILKVDINNQDVIQIELKPKPVSLMEVVVEEVQQNSFNNSFTGGEYLSNKDIGNVPSFMGEVDVLRAVRLQTGIQSVSEGNSGVYVRGGSSGQNLFLLDEMELMNPSHMMGLYSVFNPLTTGSVVVYKGNAPVNLNGRLSSAICVNTKMADKESQGVELNIGNISSTLALSLVSPNEKWSVTTGLRRSYLEGLGWAASFFLPDKKNYFKEYGYKFYDFNGKVQGKLSDKSTIMFAWYSGHDWFSLNSPEMGYQAITNGGSQSAVILYKYAPDAKNVFRHSVNFSSAASGFEGEILGNQARFVSKFQQIQQKNQWTINWNKHLTMIGLDFFAQQTLPLDMDFSFILGNISQYKEFKNAGATFYAGDTWSDPSGQLVIYAGLRGTLNAALGPYEYDNEYYGNNEIAKLWFTCAPVVSVSLFPKDGHSYKASFSVNDQNLHLATFSSIPLPNDLWMPSSPRIRPEISDQLTFGYYRQLKDIDFSVEAWGKYMKNQFIFNVVTDVSVFQGFEDQFFKGIGYAYGLECSIRKKTGLVTGSINYTFSRSRRSFSDIFNGAWFNDKYDRPHDLNINISYKLNERWNFSAVWILASGSNLSLPSGRWWMMGSIMKDYEGFNEYRFPTYHRLDVSASLNLKPKRLKESELNFSILNLYNRANPYFAYFKVSKGDDQYTLDIKSMQVSLFPIMPSISWRIKF